MTTTVNAVDVKSSAGAESKKQPKCIGSFAVLDLETSNLPAFNNNKTSITELSIYGFAAVEIHNYQKDAIWPKDSLLPKMPRVLHKMNLLFNPRMMVHPEAERLTGLSNYNLEHETHFNANAANTILGFLQHLQQPVCLVAHNGLNFDFPIVKETFAKLEMSLPESIVCVDSIRAFFEIDEQRKQVEEREAKEKKRVVESKSAENAGVDVHADVTKVEVPAAIAETATADVLSESAEIDWRELNEHTPKRLTNAAATTADGKPNGIKRKFDIFKNAEFLKDAAPQISRADASTFFKSRRSLFAQLEAVAATNSIKPPTKKKKYLPKNVYKLPNMYERIFAHPAEQAHQAEIDVGMLTQLILHYGPDFIDYAEANKLPFDEVPKVGAKTDW